VYGDAVEDLFALLIVLVGTFGTLGCTLLLVFTPMIVMIGLPFWYRSTWARWTAPDSVRAIHGNIAEGATQGPVQLVPASYLHARRIAVDGEKDAVVAGLKKTFGAQPFVTVLAEDADGLAVDLRIPSGLGPGWIGAFVVVETETGVVVDAHMRSTFCIPFPVLTFFLALSHHLHLERQVREAAAG
jgi:hypothetical protein